MYKSRKTYLKNVTWSPHFNYLSNRFNKFKIRKLTTDRHLKEESIKFLTKISSGKFIKEEKVLRVLTRKIGRYPMHRLIRRGHCILKQFRWGSRKEWCEHYKIKKTSRIVGVTPDYVGFQPSKPLVFNNYFIAFYNSVLSKDVSFMSDEFVNEIYSSITDSRIVYTGGYDTCHDHLSSSLDDDNPIQMNPRDYFKFIRDNNISDWFKSPAVSFYDPNELLYSIRINENANPGHYTSRLIGPTKMQTTASSRAAALKLYNFLKKRTIKNTYLWTVGKREKDIKLASGEGDVSTRTVLFCEDVMTTLLMWFSQKLYCALDSYSDSLFKISGEFSFQKAREAFDDEEKYDFKLDADWSFFDSTQDSGYIETALHLLLSSLPDDELHHRIRYLIISSNITKYIVMPPGIVVEANRGNASGHPFTTLLNCYVNLIYWSQLAYDIYGEGFSDKIRVRVYGDDAIVYFKKSDNLFKLDDFVKKRGFKSDPLVEKLTPTLNNFSLSEQPDFLKRRLSRTGLTWNFKKVFDKLFYQSKNRTLDEQILLLRSYIETSEYNEDLYNFSKRFCKYVRSTFYRKSFDDTVLCSFENILNVDLIKEKNVRFTFCCDLRQSNSYFTKIVEIYNWSLNIFNPIKDDGFFKRFIGSNEQRCDLLYYLGFNKKWIKGDNEIYEVGREKIQIFNFDSDYLNGVRNYMRSVEKGYVSYFKKRGVTYELVK